MLILWICISCGPLMAENTVRPQLKKQMERTKRRWEKVRGETANVEKLRKGDVWEVGVVL